MPRAALTAVWGSPMWRGNQLGCITPAVLGAHLWAKGDITTAVWGVLKAGSKPKWLHI